MMYLARREFGKLARVYPIDTSSATGKFSAGYVRRIRTRCWVFRPHLGYGETEITNLPPSQSTLCGPGCAVIAESPMAAMTALYSFEEEAFTDEIAAAHPLLKAIRAKSKRDL